MRNDKAAQIDFLSESLEWLHYPYCPLKRYEDDNCVVGFVCSDQPYRVYRYNLISFVLEGIAFSEVETNDYRSLEEMYDDGWRVD